MNENDHDVDMREEYDFSQARRGAILPPMAGKTRISIRIDDILAWFRDQVRNGGNYQTLMNQALRDYMSRAQTEALSGLEVRALRQQMTSKLGQEVLGLDPLLLTELVRQVVREELERAK